MRAWLATILRRLFLTAAIRDKRRKTHTDTDSGEMLHLAPMRSGVDALESDRLDAVLERLDDKVKKGFRRLPEAYRVPFVLFALDGLSYAEIAERLQIPPGTVMSRIHRARHRLRAAVGARPTL
jgi:RNA polymerase sigma-70 factor (ECF subfamily)